MRKTLSLLAFLIALLPFTFGQSINQVLKVADSTYKQKDFYGAYLAYGDALKYDTNRTDIRFKIAESARQINSFRIAAQNYVKVLASNDRQKYPEARLRIGEMLHKLGEYKSALASYQEYLSQNPQAAPEFLAMAKKGASDCEFAINLIEKSAQDPNLGYYPKTQSMGPLVNGPYTDYGPSYRKDTLYHTSYEFTEPGDKKTLYNKVVRTYPGMAKELLPPSYNAPGKHTAYSAFTPDGNGVYFCLCEPLNAADLRCDIYYRNLSQPNATPIKLSINQAAPITNTSPAVGKNTRGESVLYFVSNRVGGKGKLDIWMGPIQADGNVNNAEPLQEFNTTENDITPFYQETPDKKLFFFSSDGWPSFGGYDIFASRVNTSYRWSKPFNLGVTTNSSYDEIGYIRDAKGDTAVFASNRPGSILLEKNQEVCCHDLFKSAVYKFITLEVNTFKWRDSLALNGTTVSIYEEVASGSRKELLNKTDPSGNHHSIRIERDKKYYIRAEKKGYISEDSLVLSNLGEELNTLTVNLYLPDLRLDAFTLLGPASNNNPPLNGCTVSLYEKNANGQFVALGAAQTKPDANEYNYEVEFNKIYLVKASKAGFSSDSTEVPMDQNTIREFGYDISVDLFLQPVRLAIDLFFDNAIPGRNPATTTTEQYQDLFNTYVKQEEKFSGFAGQLIRSFFQNEVKTGFNQLEERIPGILNELVAGRQVKVYMSGFASPLGNAVYNQRLGSRRMSSVINYLKVAKGGALKKFIDEGKLTFDLEAIGEDPSKPDIPDKLADVREAIYSLSPSRDRKVRIYRIDITDAK